MYDRWDRPALSDAAKHDARRIELLAALHWNISLPFAHDEPELGARAALLGRCIGAQVAGIVPPDAVNMVDLILASTVLSTAFHGPIGRQLMDTIESECGTRPIAHLHAYMCTGWGYALRWLSRYTNARFAVICIVDVDVHDLSLNRLDDQIGKLGFGITTLLVQLPADAQITANTDGPYPESAFKEFIRAVKIHNAAHRPSVTFLPFFGPALSAIAAKVLASETLASNRYDTYGHCFGADPWIGLIEWFEANPLQSLTNITAGGVALPGYYTVCDIGVSPRTLLGIRLVSGRAEDLRLALTTGVPLHSAGASVL